MFLQVTRAECEDPLWQNLQKKTVRSLQEKREK